MNFSEISLWKYRTKITLTTGLEMSKQLQENVGGYFIGNTQKLLRELSLLGIIRSKNVVQPTSKFAGTRYQQFNRIINIFLPQRLFDFGVERCNFLVASKILECLCRTWVLFGIFTGMNHFTKTQPSLTIFNHFLFEVGFTNFQ